MLSDDLYWLHNLIICGRDDDEGEEDQDEDENDDDEEDEDDDDADKDDSKKKKEKSGDEGADDDDVDGLKKALAEERKKARTERRLRKKAERDARKNQKQKADDDEVKDLEKTKTELTSEKERTTKLAARLLNRERDDAIEKAARKLGFIDPTDALTDDIRREVDYDQDEDDPSDIEIDLDSVKDAVKDLADRKKHLLRGKNDDVSDVKSGSRTKRKKGDDDAADEKELKSHYASLNDY